MQTPVPSPQTTLLVLLGASEWPLFPTFQSSEAFANAAREVKAYFLDPKRFGLPPENILDLFNSNLSPDELDAWVSRFLDQRRAAMKAGGQLARDLLVYFVGHGDFVGHNADFYLAIRRTRGENPRASGISMLSLADTLTEKARQLRRILILDCCFAAAAFAAFQADPAQVALQKTNEAFEGTHRAGGFPTKGTALLCSSSHTSPSLLLPDGSSTMFTKALLEALAEGMPPQQEHLSLRDVKDLTADFLAERRNAPRPVVLSPDQSEGDVADIPFFPNPRVQEARARQAEEQARKEEEERRRRAEEERRRRDEEAVQARKAEQERLRRRIEEERRRQAEEEHARKEEEERLRRAEKKRVRQVEEKVRKAEPRTITDPGSVQPPETPIIQIPVPHAGSNRPRQSLPPAILAPVPSPTPSPTRTPRKVSRRTVLVGLAVGGSLVTSGGITWWFLTPHPLYTYRGHSNSVSSIAWSPDGRRIASGSWDKTVQVWDAGNGGNVYTYRGYSNNEVYAVAWSPDGKRIASGEGSDTGVWDAATGGNIYTYRGHSGSVTSVAWSPDGKRIASAESFQDKTVQVWDASNGGNIFTYRGHSGEVYAVAWSPNGKRIASAGSYQDGTVQVWNASNGGNIFTYRGHSYYVDAVAWSPDGRRIASAGTDVQVWDASNGGTIFTYRGHSGSVTSVAWSPDGKRIASGSEDKTVQVWDAQ